MKWATATALVSGVCAAMGIVLMRRRFAVVKVLGQSMYPALRTGDRVIVRIESPPKLQIGDVYVLQGPGPHRTWKGRPPRRSGVPDTNWIVKRLAAIPGDAVPVTVRAAVGGAAVVPDGMMVMMGDNPERSTDSREWGFAPQDQLLGKICYLLPRRVGLAFWMGWNT